MVIDLALNFLLIYFVTPPKLKNKTHFPLCYSRVSLSLSFSLSSPFSVRRHLQPRRTTTLPPTHSVWSSLTKKPRRTQCISLPLTGNLSLRGTQTNPSSLPPHLGSVSELRPRVALCSLSQCLSSDHSISVSEAAPKYTSTNQVSHAFLKNYPLYLLMFNPNTEMMGLLICSQLFSIK